MQNPDPTPDPGEPDQPHTNADPRPVRLGCVSFLNTLPLIEGLGKLPDARLTLTAPARLIDLLAEQRIDLGLISTIDLQRATEPLAILPVGMIGCKGPTLTVRLFSRVPIPRITRIHADIDSHTSIALLRVILAEAHNLSPELIDFDVDAHRAARDALNEQHAEPDWPESLLLIGDKVIADSPPAILYPHQLDLGQAWLELTKLPFVYAIWMARQTDLETLQVQRAAAILDRQRRHNATRLDWIVTHRAHVRGWPAELAQHYLRRSLRYTVTEEDRAGLELFYDKAAQHHVIPERKPTRWADAQPAPTA